MILILQHGIKVLFVIFIITFYSCSSSSNENELNLNLVIDESISKLGSGYYKKYCSNNENELDLESEAIFASFVGDYKKSFYYKSLNQTKYQINAINLIKDEEDYKEGDSFKSKLKRDVFQLSDDCKEKKDLEQLLLISERPKNLKVLFENYNPIDAYKVIIENSKDFHFTSINEAHHSGLNRCFTKSLLLPLWKNGYRYLAIEAITMNDSVINDRGFPLMTSGYYLPEPNLGNLVREAIKLGFTIVSYDQFFNTGNSDKNNNLREEAQARNILKKTIAKDSIGKVLIYSGHDHHITESLGGIKQMGWWLKELSKYDILTVDQTIMVNNYFEDKTNDYYRFVKKNYDLTNSLIFIDKSTNKALVDPIHSLSGIKLQVYHPPTEYVFERPNWMIDSAQRLYKLPKAIISKYKKSVIEFRPINESINSTPIDKFEINSNKRSILPEGDFSVRIVNCENIVQATFHLSIN